MAAQDELEKRIRIEYKKAAKEVKKKLDDFLKKSQARDKMYQQAVKAGKMSMSDYQAWQRGQVFTGERWQEKLKDITEVYVHADEKARAILNGEQRNVFVDAANKTAFEMEKKIGAGISFDLYDKNTVQRLLKDKPQMLPKWKINEQKDYTWNERRVRNSVMQGIIQGESIDDIGKRLSTELAASNSAKMEMFARTAVTGAQNAGRMERLHEAKDMGINVKKKWLATLDPRTRDTHRELDGQERDVDEPFEVDGMEIDYPGSPTADPSLTYNCRCTLIYVYPKYQQLQNGERYVQETGEKIKNMTYKEWLSSKQTIEQVQQLQHKVVNGKDITNTWTRRENEFDFEIEDVINAQGFDGKPNVVSKEEFDKAVKAANSGNGFIAQRTYSAPDQETLDAYREMLYNGKWYVDFSTGGAQYGQGMYCAADYNGELTQGIKREMTHYINQYADLGTELSENDWLKRAEIALKEAGVDDENAIKWAEAYFEKNHDKSAPLIQVTSSDDRDLWNSILRDIPRKEQPHYIETMTLSPDAKIITFRELNDMRNGNLNIGYRQSIIEDILKNEGFNNDEAIFAKYNLGFGQSISWSEVNKAANNLGSDGREKIMQRVVEIGTQVTKAYNEELEKRIELARVYQKKYHDYGSMAAGLGYDAINAEGHGESGSYTVILNRTKVIILGE